MAGNEETKSKVPLALSLGDDNELWVSSAQMHQGISEQFRVELRVRSDRPRSVDALVEQRGILRFLEEPTIAPLTGVCTMARFVSTDFDGYHYALTLEPRTAFLRLRRDHRVFKDADALGLASMLVAPLAERVGPLLADEGPNLPTHEYRVQYGESNLEALVRLLAEDGVAFVYDFAKECALRLVPDTTALDVGERGIPFMAGASLAPGSEPVVTSIAAVARERIRRVRVGDDWAERPDFDAAAELGTVTASDALEHYAFDYGVENSVAELERQAEIRLLEHVVPANVLDLQTNALVLPGMTLKVTGAPHREAADPLLVLAVESVWRAEEGGARTLHRVRCIRRDQRWVPPRPPKPKIPGVQRAVVVGEGEVDSDDVGRVLCAFDWDRGKLASRRVEVSQAWAGAGHGAFMLPRVGDEVLVSYLDGDPDEPVIIGRVYNGRNRPRLVLPEQKQMSVWTSKSTPNGEGFNEIGMDDTAGAELLWTRAQLDYDGVVERDASGKYGRDFKLEVGRHTNVKVVGLTSMVCQSPATWKGVDLTVESSGTFKLSCAVLNENVAGNASHHIGGTLRHEITGNQVSMVGGSSVVFASEISLNVPGAMISMKPGKITLIAGSSVIEIGPTITMRSPLIELNP